MTPDMSHSERAKILLEDPDRFEELVEDYEDGTDFYNKTARKVPSIDDNFEALLDYHQIFIDRGPSDYIFYNLNRNTARSIKNMLLGGSDAGKAYRIYTLAEAQQRVMAYQDLGVHESVISLDRVLETTLEEIYTETKYRRQMYPLLNTFLSDVSDVSRDVVEFVARARLVEQFQNAQANEQRRAAFEAYITQVTNPLPDEERSSRQLRVAAQNHEYSDPDRFDLHQAALRDDRSLEALFDYLYVRSRDIAERYRHRDRDNPSTAELELGKRQLELIQNADAGLGEEREAYVDSYCHLLQALLNSGLEWHTEQDPGKEITSNFKLASQEYLRSADAIKGWHDDRDIKYVSKALRHAANATETWDAKQNLHDIAIVLLLAEAQQRDTGDDALELSRSRHEFWREVAEAYLALERNDPDTAHSTALSAQGRLDELPMYESSPYHLDRALVLAGGRLMESDDDYADAAEYYASFDRRDDYIDTRQTLAKIKARIADDATLVAIEIAQNELNDDSLVLSVLQILADEEFESTQNIGSLPHALLRDVDGVEETLQLLVTLSTSTDTLNNEIKNHLRIVLFDL